MSSFSSQLHIFPRVIITLFNIYKQYQKNTLITYTSVSGNNTKESVSHMSQAPWLAVKGAGG